MNINDLKQGEKIQFISIFYRKSGIFIAHLIKKININPNLISFFSFFIAVIAVFFFLKYHYVIGFIFLNLSIIFDYVDGSYARLKNKTSKTGEFIDNNLDALVDFIVISSLVYSLYKIHFDELLLICGIIILSLRYLILIIYLYTSSAIGEFVSTKIKDKSNIFKVLLMQFVYSRATIFLLLFLSTITGLLYYGIYLLALYSILFYIFFFIYLFRLVRKNEKHK